MNKDGGPAYPRTGFVADGHAVGGVDAERTRTEPTDGVSVRDYFAIRILAARLVAHPKPQGTSWEEYADLSSYLAYQFADKMLEAQRK